MSKSYFNPKFFTPFACRVFTKYCQSQPKEGDITLRFYANDNLIQYEVIPNNYTVFLPNKVLNNCRFAKISEESKKVVLNMQLSEKEFLTLVSELGGSVRKRTQISTKLGDILKI